MNLFPYNSQIDFMRLRTASLLVALALMLVSVAAIPLQGFNFALDFTSGSRAVAERCLCWVWPVASAP